LLSLHLYRAHRALHSFPTRRSSDLLTPKSSFGLLSTAGSVVHTLVLAYFHISPLQPLISLGSGMQPGGLPEESQRFASAGNGNRSEEHTSELQSRFDLVCRLLLEKK